MNLDRRQRWWTSRAESFDAGKAHEENLAYLLGGAFRRESAWSQLLGCFTDLVDASERVSDVRRIRAIFFLTDATGREPPFPGFESLVDQQDARPPSLVLLGDFDDRAWRQTFDVRAEVFDLRGEVPPGTTATYEITKRCDEPDDAPYRRSITLEYVVQ